MSNYIIVRSQDEIVERCREAQKRDFFGFETDDYISCLDFAHLRLFLKPEATAEELDKVQADWKQSTLEEIDKEAKGYMEFWLEKIENERGLSVVRATQHFMAWKWLLGHKDADTFPGSLKGGDGGWYQRRAYDYIKNQIDSGEWDKLCAEAIEKAKATT